MQQGQIDPIIVTIFFVTGFLVNEISLLGLRQDAVLTIISILLILVMKHLKDPGNIFLLWGRWERAACLLKHLQCTYYNNCVPHYCLTNFLQSFVLSSFVHASSSHKTFIFLSQFTLLYPFLYSISHFLGPRGPLLLPMVANDYLEDLAS